MPFYAIKEEGGTATMDIINVKKGMLQLISKFHNSNISQQRWRAEAAIETPYHLFVTLKKQFDVFKDALAFFRIQYIPISTTE